MTPPLIRHQPIDVRTLVYVPVPEALTLPTPVPAVTVATNADLLDARDALAEALRQCNDDKADVAKLQGTLVPAEGADDGRD